MSWYRMLFGVLEETGEEGYLATRAKFKLGPEEQAAIPGSQSITAPNGRTFPVGSLTTPRLIDLRNRLTALYQYTRHDAPTQLVFDHVVVNDILDTHVENPRACFQVASQFNALEFSSPSCVPEDGITIYAHDPTQGPSCSLAAAAATLYRNYFLPVPSSSGTICQIGQSRDTQINCLEHLLEQLGDSGNQIQVKNGYTFASSVSGLKMVKDAINDSLSREELMQSLRVCCHRGVGVTFSTRWKPLPHDMDVRVTQVFCSALSIAYDGNNAPMDLWEPLARIVLDGSYESVLLQAAIDRFENVGDGVTFLTFIGGGVFGNDPHWIADAIARALYICRALPLRVKICHHRAISPEMQGLIDWQYARLSCKR